MKTVIEMNRDDLIACVKEALLQKGKKVLSIVMEVTPERKDWPSLPAIPIGVSLRIEVDDT